MNEPRADNIDQFTADQLPEPSVLEVHDIAVEVWDHLLDQECFGKFIDRYAMIQAAPTDEDRSRTARILMVRILAEMSGLAVE